MVQDYAKRKSPAKTKAKNKGKSREKGKTKQKKRPARQLPTWVILFTGVVTGLFIGFLVYLARLAPGEIPIVEDAQKEFELVVDEVKSKAAESDLKFEFYQILPDFESLASREAEGGEERTAQRHKKYLLQAGSFRNKEDAGGRKAELLMMGHDVALDEVRIREGERWYRVMVGPFDNQNTMYTAKDKLGEAGIETLPVEIRE